MSIRTQQATQMISQCRPNDSVDIPNPSNRITQGVTFTAVANKLIKSGPDGLFISKGVRPGDIALNVNSGFNTTVVTVESESSLLLASNIFTVANQAFAVFRSVPNGGSSWTPCIRIISSTTVPYDVNLITAGGDSIIFRTTGLVTNQTLGNIQVRRVLATGTDAGLIFAAFE